MPASPTEEANDPAQMQRMKKRSVWLAVAVGGIFAAANIFLLTLAAKDRSWGAMGIAIFGGPVINFILCVFSLCCSSLIRMALGGGSTRMHKSTSILTPIGFIAFDLVAIFSMDLHGC